MRPRGGILIQQPWSETMLSSCGVRLQMSPDWLLFNLSDLYRRTGRRDIDIRSFLASPIVCGIMSLMKREEIQSPLLTSKRGIQNDITMHTAFLPLALLDLNLIPSLLLKSMWLEMREQIADSSRELNAINRQIIPGLQLQNMVSSTKLSQYSNSIDRLILLGASCQISSKPIFASPWIEIDNSGQTIVDEATLILEGALQVLYLSLEEVLAKRGSVVPYYRLVSSEDLTSTASRGMHHVQFQ